MNFLQRINWVAVLTFATGVLIQVTNGTISFTHQLPPGMIDQIKEVAANGATILSLAAGVFSIGRVPASQVAKVAAIALLGSFLMVGQAKASDVLPAAVT